MTEATPLAVPSESPQRHSRVTWYVVALLALGFGLRLGVFLLHDYVGNADQVGYTLAATRLIEGEMPDRRPGLTALIAAALALGIPEDRAARTVSVLTGTLMLLLIWILVRRLYGAPAGVAALTLAVVNQHLILTSTDGMKEAPTLCALIGALICLSVALRRDHALGWHASAGLLFGIAYSVRTEAAVYLAGVLGALAVILVLNPPVRRRLFAAAAIMAAGFATIAVPTTLMRGAVHDTSAPSALLQYDPMFSGEAEELREVTSGRLPDEWVEDIGVEPPRLTWKVQAKRYVHNLYEQVAVVLPETIDIGLWLLIGLGLFGERWRTGRWKIEIIFAGMWLFFFTAAPLAQLVHPRHLLPYLVIGICWAGAGATSFGRWYSRTTRDGEVTRDGFRRGIIIAVVFVALFQLKPDLDFVQAAFNGEVETEEKAAGLWLAEHAQPGDVALERKTVVAFYADIGHDELPHVSLERVIEYARMHGADYIIVSSRHLDKYRPQLLPLLGDELTCEPDLIPLNEFHNRHNPDMFVRIFKVMPEAGLPTEETEGSPQ